MKDYNLAWVSEMKSMVEHFESQPDIKKTASEMEADFHFVVMTDTAQNSKVA